MKIYIEGGGDGKDLISECRKGFISFFEKACPGVPHPKFIPCGTRASAYDDFCTAVSKGEKALLLVDSEAPVNDMHQQGDSAGWRPWLHLQVRDGWRMPDGACEMDCHLMVQSMESWFIADSAELQAFFGEGFNTNPLPKNIKNIEKIAKDDIYKSIDRAVMHCTTRGKSHYSKGDHSFKILLRINPNKVREASPWAERFIHAVRSKMER